ncbi:diacylglycerol kinase [Planococcus antarcticus DSM 14505]|uniref:Diacylglycerol kinase n=1 Tax=Planococcus antarcticus DSM 14505 TaxID=1185653 RepID=A0A1C7DJ36_9BACL|nr:diacylglycerol kinase family protein [Planococcus antarcticus]ANU11233.1 UDP kinase [Planococcus antarcticus DSM 14505]EIM07865.1 diacylglycerol kinase [Planococcus antarcticus DSM 14505]
MKARRFFRSFQFAAQGIGTALKREQNIRFHFLAAIVVVFTGILTGLSYMEWLVVILLIGGMIALEMINSAIERVVDLATVELHPLAKQSKDMAAGAVLVFASASAIIGLLIFLPKWL